ncbi:hypothetical protein H696_04317 [Fonticula alba]|uniref:Protein kinase domain-containing protein n=1 Tax=Fonticula alba TaxID=691883 RepID=A0A058Z4P6_FONAL|nr:hypothetical protein H696_04317 [Fonticula alba]KCV68898.1 hypothetical protein H696_04317 [Fonticula alba]|eukprot:XP_009496469.1 hypothetical protein H696_04317 [Fonticula alba]
MSDRLYRELRAYRAKRRFSSGRLVTLLMLVMLALGGLSVGLDLLAGRRGTWAAERRAAAAAAAAEEAEPPLPDPRSVRLPGSGRGAARCAEMLDALQDVPLLEECWTGAVAGGSLPVESVPVEVLPLALRWWVAFEGQPLYRPAGRAVGSCDHMRQGLPAGDWRADPPVAQGTVKSIHRSTWLDRGSGRRVPVAVLALRRENLIGDFSSGISRLIALAGHPNVWPLLAACPRWEGFTGYGTPELGRKLVEARRTGARPGDLKAAVAPFAELGSLDNLESTAILEGIHLDVAARMSLALQLLRLHAFLHDDVAAICPEHPVLGVGMVERSPLRGALLQHDFKPSQFLVAWGPGRRLSVYLNDAEAMPLFRSPLQGGWPEVCPTPKRDTREEAAPGVAPAPEAEIARELAHLASLLASVTLSPPAVDTQQLGQMLDGAGSAAGRSGPDRALIRLDAPWPPALRRALEDVLRCLRAGGHRACSAGQAFVRLAAALRSHVGPVAAAPGGGVV